MPPPAPGPSRRALAVLAVVLGLTAGLLSLTSLANLAPGAAAAPAAEPQLPPVPGFPLGEESEPADPRAQDFPSMPRRCATRKQQIPKTPMRCVLRSVGKHRPTIVLWGDSHLWMMLPAVRAAVKGRKVNLVGFLFGGCVPARPDMEVWAGQPCAETADLANRYLARMTRQGRDVRVVLGSFWGAQLNRVYYFPSREIARSAKERRKYVMAYTKPLFRWLGRKGIPTDVLVQGPIAVPPDPDCEPGPTPYGCDIPRFRAYYKEDYVRGFLQRQVRHLPRGARLIDYADSVCRARTCSARQGGGVQTWYDPYHLSTATTSRMGRLFAPTVAKVLRR